MQNTDPGANRGPESGAEHAQRDVLGKPADEIHLNIYVKLTVNSTTLAELTTAVLTYFSWAC